MPPTSTQRSVSDFFERVGRAATASLAEFGFAGVLVAQSLFWLFFGPRLRQPVRMGAIVAQMREVGINAIPIVAVLSAAIGAVLAMQGIISLKKFGAESQVTFGIAISMVREFAPLITGILVAGRSGSALAARVGTMKINQEMDALEVMGINPVRFLVAPALFAMLVMVPALTVFSGFMGLYAGGLYVGIDLSVSMDAYITQVIDALDAGDVLHGFAKSVAFAALIAIIGVMNGAGVQGGAEGVGKATTRSVVQAISAIVITDMIFVLMATQMG
ncbi:MAG: ABC transporter permease [Alphaproteobacteria bacterium]|nr:ABC transporter permease [Alphaproteobacteria bacterium]